MWWLLTALAGETQGAGHSGGTIHFIYREVCERRLQDWRDDNYHQDFYGEKTDDQWLEVIK